MKLKSVKSLKEIADFLNCKFIGDPEHQVTGLNEIHMVEAGDLVFVDHPKYYKKALNSAATTVLIDQEVDCPEGKGLLISEKPFDDYNKLTKHFSPFIAQDDLVNSNAEIHETAVIFPNVFIGDSVKIGANTIVYSGACIGNRTVIGDDCVVGPNTVLGHAAFYYKKKDTGFDRMHTCGNVELQDRVEIGALCTLDAGVSGTTFIGAGTKIDNQVHIGHDTIIGKDCLLAANVGLAGCVRIENKVTLWGQVGCASDVVIGEGAVVMAQSGISKSLEGGKTYFGSPCAEVRVKYREMAAIKKLPEILEKI